MPLSFLLISQAHVATRPTWEPAWGVLTAGAARYLTAMLCPCGSRQELLWTEFGQLPMADQASATVKLRFWHTSCANNDSSNSAPILEIMQLRFPLEPLPLLYAFFHSQYLLWGKTHSVLIVHCFNTILSFLGMQWFSRYLNTIIINKKASLFQKVIILLPTYTTGYLKMTYVYIRLLIWKLWAITWVESKMRFKATDHSHTSDVFPNLCRETIWNVRTF